MLPSTPTRICSNRKIEHSFPRSAETSISKKAEQTSPPIEPPCLPVQKLPNDVLLMVGDAANDPQVWAALSACSRDLQRRTEPSLYRTFTQLGKEGRAIRSFYFAIVAKPHRANLVRQITAKQLPNNLPNNKLNKREQEFLKSKVSGSVLLGYPGRSLSNEWIRDLSTKELNWDAYFALILLLTARNLQSLTLLDVDIVRSDYFYDVVYSAVRAQKRKHFPKTDCLANLRTIKILDIVGDGAETVATAGLYPLASLPSVVQLETNITYYQSFQYEMSLGYPPSSCTHLVLRPKDNLIGVDELPNFLHMYPSLKSCIYIAPGNPQARRMRRIAALQQRRFQLSLRQLLGVLYCAITHKILGLIYLITSKLSIVPLKFRLPFLRLILGLYVIASSGYSGYFDFCLQVPTLYLKFRQMDLISRPVIFGFGRSYMADYRKVDFVLRVVFVCFILWILGFSSHC